MRTAIRGLVPAVLAAAVATALAGCSTASGDGGAKDPKPADSTSSAGSAEPGADGAADRAGDAVAKGSTLGGPGSPCALPVTFDLAADWKPEAVTVDPDSELGDLLAKQGPVTLVCEIDAKPAGHIGFLRVWTGDTSPRTPRQVLEAFMADEQNADRITYKEIKAGTVPAAEVTYTVHSELLDETTTKGAFALTTPDGPVVVHLGGLDSQEHKAMLPAYELAKQSVRLG